MTKEKKQERALRILRDYFNDPSIAKSIKICKIFERSFTFTRETEYIFVVGMVELFEDWESATYRDISIAESVVKRYKD